jgi:hypothetical protein
MVLDLVGFTLLFIMSSLLLLLRTIKQSNIKIIDLDQSPNQFIGLLLVCVGSFIFILGSLSWRASTGFIPNNLLSDYTFDQFIGDEIANNEKRTLAFIQVILRGLLISNFGLLIYSLGFGSVFDDQTYPYTTELMYIYGILNFVFCLGGPLAIIKPLITPPLAAIVYWRTISPTYKDKDHIKNHNEQPIIT